MNLRETKAILWEYLFSKISFTWSESEKEAIKKAKSKSQLSKAIMGAWIEAEDIVVSAEGRLHECLVDLSEENLGQISLCDKKGYTFIYGASKLKMYDSKWMYIVKSSVILIKQSEQIRILNSTINSIKLSDNIWARDTKIDLCLKSSALIDGESTILESSMSEVYLSGKSIIEKAKLSKLYIYDKSKVGDMENCQIMVNKSGY